MTDTEYTDDELLAYVDEMLPEQQMTTLEEALRRSESLRRRVSWLVRRRDSGSHSVGEIWRRERLSCPSRSQLGSFLLETLDGQLADYIDFHLRTVGCQYCVANLNDLRQKMEAAPETRHRRRRFFQSSVGYLRGMDGA